MAAHGSWAVAVAVVAWGEVGRADDAPVLLLAEGSCPDTAAVAAALAPLLPGLRLVTQAQPDPGPQARAQTAAIKDGAPRPVKIQDLGESFRVSVGERSREMDDAQRDCAERARTAAVFAALAIAPPRVPPWEETRAQEPADRAAAGARPQAAARGARAIRIELLGAGVFDVSATATAMWMAGGALRFAVGTPVIGGVVGIAGLSPTTLVADDVQVRMLRFPIDASLRAAWQPGRLLLAGEVGFAVVPLLAEGLNQPLNRTARGVDLGVRAALELRLIASRALHPWFSMQVTAIPVPATIEVDGRGQVGTTPTVWIAWNVGVAWRIR